MLLGLAPGAGFDVTSLDDLDTYLGAAAAAGFEAVSLSITQLCGQAPAAAKLVAAHGLTCTDVLSLMVTRDDEETMAAVDALRPAVEALEPIGVLTMVRTRVGEESLDRMGRAAEHLGVPLLLEFATAPLPTAAAASAVVDALGTSRARVLADAFHFFRAGSTLDMLEAIPLEHLAIVQFDDALPALSDDYMEETMHRRAWPGDGELELTAMVEVLRRRGWDGVVSVEVLSRELRQLPVDEFARQAFATTAPYWR